MEQAKHLRLWAIALVGATVIPSLASAQPAASAATEEIVVDFDDATSDAEVQRIARENGIQLTANSILVSDDRIYRATVPIAQANQLFTRLRGISAVQSAEENRVLTATFAPNDPRYSEQWNMQRVGAPRAWNVTCGSGVTVAVIDTGVACSNHGDFTRVQDLAGTHCVSGYDFVSDDEHADDEHGHGTHVAGTIAQTTNNGFGVAGLAYCANIMPVRVLNENGSGTLADVAEGIRWAADHGAQVINLSLGGGGHSKVMADAVAHARSRGTVVVCAAGNNGRYVESPAVEPGAFAVSAIDSGDQIAYFSSRGPEIDLAAPGVMILQQTVCDHGRNRCEQFAAWSGTSMAAPHVAAAAALVMSMGVTNPDAVERILRQSSAQPAHGDVDKNLYGAGIVDAAHAVRSIVWNQAMYRGIILLGLTLALAYQIRQRKGKLAHAGKWLPTALLSSVGLFFVTMLIPHTIPGIDFIARPIGDWSMSLGSSMHRWLPFANAGVVLALVGLLFGRKGARAPVGGFALGTCAYLLATSALGYHAGPLGNTLQTAWVALNAMVCFWVARIGLDQETAKD